MSVTDDVKNSVLGIFERLKADNDRALSDPSRYGAMLNYSLSMHDLYIKMVPFENEISQIDSNVWKIIYDGEAFANGSVDKLSSLISSSFHRNVSDMYKVHIQTNSQDDDDYWERSKKFANDCVDNVKENWDRGVEEIGQLANDIFGWEKDSMDKINRDSDEISNGRHN